MTPRTILDDIKTGIICPPQVRRPRLYCLEPLLTVHSGPSDTLGSSSDLVLLTTEDLPAVISNPYIHSLLPAVDASIARSRSRLTVDFSTTSPNHQARKRRQKSSGGEKDKDWKITLQPENQEWNDSPLHWALLLVKESCQHSLINQPPHLECATPSDLSLSLLHA